jgi:uncharacterized membrane protein YdfJ with MMPL/SSD domain
MSFLPLASAVCTLLVIHDKLASEYLVTFGAKKTKCICKASKGSAWVCGTVGQPLLAFIIIGYAIDYVQN